MSAIMLVALVESAVTWAYAPRAEILLMTLPTWIAVLFGTYMVLRPPPPRVYQGVAAQRIVPEFQTTPNVESQRARRLLINTVGEEYGRALLNGNTVIIHATNGLDYGVNIHGRIFRRVRTRIFQATRDQGYLVVDEIPMEDAVASFIVWARTDPEDLQRRWGCGRIPIRDRTRRQEP